MSEESKKKLNTNQEMFCQLYAGGGEYFGNGVWSYVLAYKIQLPIIDYKRLSEEEKATYDSACQMASELLRKVEIQNYCNELIDALIKDEIVDRELARVIMQNDELSPKVQAIREYNAVKKRTLNKLEIEFPQNLIDLIRGIKNEKPADKE